MTTQTRTAPVQDAAVTGRAGDTGAKWRRRVVYLFLIGYAK